MANKNYTSLYRIKEFLMNNIAPKYLNSDEINISQIGLFGYITETLSVLGEDGLNSTSIVFKECFANAAENIESLHLMAAIYQLDSYFASAASMPFIIILNEDDIIENGQNENDQIKFHIDKNTRFVIDDIEFSLEYDIQISSKATNKGYIHNAQYLIGDEKLSFSTITNQYIRSKVQKYNKENFVALLVTLRQMQSREYNESIVSNDKIHYNQMVFNLGSETLIAGFEAYYKSPDPTEREVQLIKKMENTPKETEPFCFYTMPDDGVLRISFSNDDRFFKPEFNSNLRIVIYTTEGSKGNFEAYTGDNINIIPTSERYSENNGLIMFGQCAGNSRGGKNAPTMEEFRDMVVAAQSTVLSYSTDNDLAIYFKKIASAEKTRIMFMKRRDDSLIRLFNAFTLLTDSNNVVLPTNTCDLFLFEKDIDSYHTETHRCVCKAGKIYKYYQVEGYHGTLTIDDELSIHDDLDEYEDDFVYTNPFLMVMSSRPVNVGMYLNSVDDVVQMDIENVNQDSFVQFMVSGLSIYRNAILGEDEYVFKIKVIPTTDDLRVCVEEKKDDMLVSDEFRTFEQDGVTYIDYKRIKVLMVFTDNGSETCYLELNMIEANASGHYYVFEGRVKTDDFVSSNNKMRLINSVKDITTNEDLDEKFVPNNNMTVNLYTFYKYGAILDSETDDDDQENEAHAYTSRGIAVGYTLTNKYVSDSSTMYLIKPLNMIRSQLTYQEFYKSADVLDYYYRIASVPVIKANYVKNPETFKKFIYNITSIYDYLNAEIDKLTNNFSIDIKFYNTYGKSRHYGLDITGSDIAGLDLGDVTLIDDKWVCLDTINIRLKFAIKPYYTTDIENLVKDIKQYILDYLRNDFDNFGNNAYYNSNLMRSLENDFKDKIEYIIFKGINKYPLEVQKLEPIINNENVQDYYDSMLDYVPEYVNIYYLMKNGESEPMITIDVL